MPLNLNTPEARQDLTAIEITDFHVDIRHGRIVVRYQKGVKDDEGTFTPASDEVLSVSTERAKELIGRDGEVAQEEKDEFADIIRANPQLYDDIKLVLYSFIQLKTGQLGQVE